MFEQIKNFFTKRFISEIEENREIPQPDEKSFREGEAIPPVPREIQPSIDSSPESFEPARIKPSQESVIKRTKRALKYRY